MSKSKHEVLKSRATRVTFFEDRAEVRRVTRVSAVEGVTFVNVSGVSPLVDDSSIVARIISDNVGSSRVLASRVRRRLVRESDASDEEVAELEAEVDRTEFEASAARRERDRIISRRQRLLESETEFLNALERAPAGVDGWAGSFAMIDTRAASTFDELADARVQVEDASRHAERAKALWRQALAEKPRIESVVELQVELTADVVSLDDVEVELVYLLPCALWRPSHVAKLDEESSTDNMTLVNEATVWQRTGERWKDIEAHFSTARPSRAVSPPLLEDDELRARPRQEMKVEGRDVTIEQAGAKGARQLDEMPGVDDGGEPLVLKAPGLVTIPSDGQPTRIELGSTTLSAEVSTVAYPEYGPTPHVRGRANWKGDRPILAGPVRVMRGHVYVGVARLDFVAPGAILEMGFGRDSGVTVRRTSSDEQKTTMTGTRRITRSVTLFCSNLSDQTRKIWVVERVPVSEVEEVKVTMVDAAGGALNDDGFLTFKIELRPHANEKREISYRVEHGSSVHLSL